MEEESDKEVKESEDRAIARLQRAGWFTHYPVNGRADYKFTQPTELGRKRLRELDQILDELDYDGARAGVPMSAGEWAAIFAFRQIET